MSAWGMWFTLLKGKRERISLLPNSIKLISLILARKTVDVLIYLTGNGLCFLVCCFVAENFCQD